MQLQTLFEKLEKLEFERPLLQKVILALLAVDGKPIYSRIKLQKMIFLLSNLIPELKESVHFKPYDYGMYDEGVDTALELLESEGAVTVNDSGIKLANKDLGEKVLEELRPYLETIRKIKEEYNDLTDEEVLAIVYTLYPEYAKYSLKRGEIEKKKREIAIDLYRKGKISLGFAAKMAGLPLKKFIDLLKKRGIKIVIEE